MHNDLDSEFWRTSSEQWEKIKVPVSAALMANNKSGWDLFKVVGYQGRFR